MATTAKNTAKPCWRNHRQGVSSGISTSFPAQERTHTHRTGHALTQVNAKGRRGEQAQGDGERAFLDRAMTGIKEKPRRSGAICSPCATPGNPFIKARYSMGSFML